MAGSEPKTCLLPGTLRFQGEACGPRKAEMRRRRPSANGEGQKTIYRTITSSRICSTVSLTTLFPLSLSLSRPAHRRALASYSPIARENLARRVSHRSQSLVPCTCVPVTAFAKSTSPNPTSTTFPYARLHICFSSSLPFCSVYAHEFVVSRSPPIPQHLPTSGAFCPSIGPLPRSLPREPLCSPPNHHSTAPCPTALQLLSSGMRKLALATVGSLRRASRSPRATGRRSSTSQALNNFRSVPRCL